MSVLVGSEAPDFKAPTVLANGEIKADYSLHEAKA